MSLSHFTMMLNLGYRSVGFEPCSWRYNDGGRAAAGYKGTTGDCVTRAIAIGTGLPYGVVYELVNEHGAKERVTRGRKRHGKSSASTGVWGSTTRRILAKLGWVWTPTMGIGTGCKVHLRASELPKGRVIVKASRHLVAVLDGVINDTNDPSRSGSRCVYGFWTPPDLALCKPGSYVLGGGRSDET